MGGEASPSRAGELGKVRRARRDPSRACPGTAHLPATGPVRPVRLPRPDLARERQAHEAGARTRATAHERTPQQERQKAAREAERGREAWTLGQGHEKARSGLLRASDAVERWRDVVYMALL